MSSMYYSYIYYDNQLTNNTSESYKDGNQIDQWVHILIVSAGKRKYYGEGRTMLPCNGPPTTIPNVMFCMIWYWSLSGRRVAISIQEILIYIPF